MPGSLGIEQLGRANYYARTWNVGDVAHLWGEQPEEDNYPSTQSCVVQGSRSY